MGSLFLFEVTNPQDNYELLILLCIAMLNKLKSFYKQYFPWFVDFWYYIFIVVLFIVLALIIL